MNLNLSEFSASQIYHLMTQTVIPRPIAWVLSENMIDKESSHDKVDNYNLAPFSYFNAVCSDPPLLMISIGKKPSGEQKDTSINLKLGAKAVVHIANTAQAAALTKSAASLNYGESELNQLDLALSEQMDFELPRLAACPVCFNCEVYKVDTIGEADQTLVFLKIVSMFVDDKACSEDEKGRLSISADAINPLARLGANQYSGISGVLNINRPS